MQNGGNDYDEHSDEKRLVKARAEHDLIRFQREIFGKQQGFVIVCRHGNGQNIDKRNERDDDQ